ncbi:MAG: DUF3099 domain-containing protein [Candidatus Nanopelagicales bacterium]
MTTPFPEQQHGADDVFNVTSAQRALSEEQTGRTRKYLISMLIRTVCVIAAIFVPGWPRWILIAGAVALPYLAVVIANAGRENDEIGDLGVMPLAHPSLPVSSGNIVSGVIHEPTSPEPK